LLRKQFEEGIGQQESDVTNRTVQSLARLQPYGGSALPQELQGIAQEGIKARTGLERDLSLATLDLSEQDRLRREAQTTAERSALDTVSFGGLEQENIINAQQGSDLLSRLFNAELGRVDTGIQSQRISDQQRFQENLLRATTSADISKANALNNIDLNKLYLSRSYQLQDAASQSSFLQNYLNELRRASKTNPLTGILAGAKAGSAFGPIGGIVGAGVGGYASTL